MPLRQRGAAGLRRVVTAVALLALVPLVGAAAPSVTSEVDLRLGRPQAITGEPVDLRVTVEPVVARPVALQRRAGDRWVEVTRGRTDASGVEVLTGATPRASTTYRVRAPRVVRGGTTYAADVSPVRTLTVQQQKAILRMPETASTGTTWAFVECFPHRPGRAVLLRQRRGDGAWTTVADGVQDGGGMVLLDAPVPVEGVYEHRAVVAAANGARAVRTVARRTTVTAPP